MNANEQLIRNIAKEMAKVDDKFFETYLNNKGFYHSVINERIAAFTPFARIAVKHMADTFSIGYDEGAKWGISYYTNIRVINMMIERGLIPPTENEIRETN